MQETPTANQAQNQPFVERRHPLGVREPTEYDKMITDLLKHITTLNTGLLAIIAAFNQQIVPLFQRHTEFTTYFVLTFFISLALCMFGFVSTIFVLHRRDARTWARRREIMVFIAAIGYVFSLMFLLALLTQAYQVT